MMKKNIILDLDGTILEGKLRHYQCYYDILSQLQKKTLPLTTYWQLKRRGYKLPQILQLTQADDQVNTFSQYWLENIEAKKYLQLDELFPEVMTILQQWRQQGIKILLTTLRKNSENLYWQLDYLKIVSLFDQVIVAASATEKAMGAKKFITPDEAQSLWIGDTEVDYQAAKQLNVPVCLVSSGLREQEFLQALQPQFLADNIAAFAKKLVIN